MDEREAFIALNGWIVVKEIDIQAEETAYSVSRSTEPEAQCLYAYRHWGTSFPAEQGYLFYEGAECTTIPFSKVPRKVRDKFTIEALTEAQDWINS